MGVEGAEWRTSGGMFCTERCQVKEREGLSVYTCPAVDGSKVEYNPRSVFDSLQTVTDLTSLKVEHQRETCQWRSG